MMDLFDNTTAALRELVVEEKAAFDQEQITAWKLLFDSIVKIAKKEVWTENTYKLFLKKYAVASRIERHVMELQKEFTRRVSQMTGPDKKVLNDVVLAGEKAMGDVQVTSKNLGLSMFGGKRASLEFVRGGSQEPLIDWANALAESFLKFFEACKALFYWLKDPDNTGSAVRPLRFKNGVEVEHMTMSGFKVMVVDYDPDDIGVDAKRDMYGQAKMMGRLQNALKIARTRTSKFFPDLLKDLPPIVAYFSQDHEQNLGHDIAMTASAYYNESDNLIAIRKQALYGDTEKVIAATLVHEFAHFLYTKRYSKQDRLAWSKLVNGEIEIDLEQVADLLKGAKTQEAGRKQLYDKDPLLAMRFEALRLGGYKRLQWTTADPYMEEGLRLFIKMYGRFAKSKVRPISVYGSTNPDEAFSEAVMNLVAYGPRTLQPEVVAMLKQLSPGVKTEEKLDYTGSVLRYRVLSEMAMLPSLVNLQKKGNKREASKEELANARKRALKCKTADEARAGAKSAWELMQKRQIIQVFLDRMDELLGYKYRAPKPEFIDQKVVPWASLTKEQREAAVKWLAVHKTMDQLRHMFERAKSLARTDKSKDSEARVQVYTKSMEQQKQAQKEWREAANARKHYFGR